MTMPTICWQHMHWLLNRFRRQRPWTRWELTYKDKWRTLCVRRTNWSSYSRLIRLSVGWSIHPAPHPDPFHNSSNSKVRTQASSEHHPPPVKRRVRPPLRICIYTASNSRWALQHWIYHTRGQPKVLAIRWHRWLLPTTCHWLLLPTTRHLWLHNYVDRRLSLIASALSISSYVLSEWVTSLQSNQMPSLWLLRPKTVR